MYQFIREEEKITFLKVGEIILRSIIDTLARDARIRGPTSFFFVKIDLAILSGLDELEKRKLDQTALPLATTNHME